METVTAVGGFVFHSLRHIFYLVHPDEIALNDGDEAPQILLKHGIPAFFILMAMEWLYIRLSGDKNLAPVRLNDTIVSTLLGSFQLLFLVGMELIGLAWHMVSYEYVFRNFRVTTIDVKANPWLWFVVGLLAKDLAYYWMHRYLHVYHVGWISHSVHHSGETYDLATALRQGAAQPLLGFIFYLPIAALGYPPAAFMAHSQLNTNYQFWIHTDVINRLPFGLEYVLNSPQAHRLHHRPPGNTCYAGVLIIWDRMFGTYRTETVRKDLYGLAGQPNTFDLLTLNVRHLSVMNNIRTANSWLGRFFARRAKHPLTVSLSALFEPIPPVKSDERHKGPVRRKWDGAERLGFFMTLYVSVLALVALVGALVVLLTVKAMHLLDGVACVVLALTLLSNIGRLCDNVPGERGWVFLTTLVVTPAVMGVMYYRPFEQLLA